MSELTSLTIAAARDALRKGETTATEPNDDQPPVDEDGDGHSPDRGESYNFV